MISSVIFQAFKQKLKLEVKFLCLNFKNQNFIIKINTKFLKKKVLTTDVNGKILVTNRCIRCFTRMIAILVRSLQYLHLSPNRMEATPKSP